MAGMTTQNQQKSNAKKIKIKNKIKCNVFKSVRSTLLYYSLILTLFKGRDSHFEVFVFFQIFQKQNKTTSIIVFKSPKVLNYQTKPHL